MENKSNHSADDPVTKKQTVVPTLMESGILTPLKIQEALVEECENTGNDSHQMVKRCLRIGE